jgi:hypothetical protein
MPAESAMARLPPGPGDRGSRNLRLMRRPTVQAYELAKEDSSRFLVG